MTDPTRLPDLVVETTPGGTRAVLLVVLVADEAGDAIDLTGWGAELGLLDQFREATLPPVNEAETDRDAGVVAFDLDGATVLAHRERAGLDLTLTPPARPSFTAAHGRLSAVLRASDGDPATPKRVEIAVTVDGQGEPVRVGATVYAGPEPSDEKIDAAIAAFGALTQPEADLLYRRIGQLVALADVEGLAAALLAKADLVGGKLVTSQLPPIATAEVVAVADEAAMLALTPAEVQPGDRALRQDLDQSPIYVLTGADPSALASWRRQVEVPGIYSVNGQSGSEVTLGAADVGASPSGHLHDERYRRLSESVPQASVSGLAAALAARPTGTGISAIVALTQAAYDALTPDPTTLYVVTD